MEIFTETSVDNALILYHGKIEYYVQVCSCKIRKNSIILVRITEAIHLAKLGVVFCFLSAVGFSLKYNINNIPRLYENNETLYKSLPEWHRKLYQRDAD